ncbi:MAG TPA: four helix bundle protein [Thermoanaerobaculia bacterium]
MAQSYRDLVAWQKALDLVAAVYEVSRAFPKEEVYGLTAQVRRAAVSVISNIAEGKGRWSKREFQHFLAQSRGSLLEVETQILVSQRLGYLSELETDRIVKMTEEVGRVLNGLMAAVKRNAQTES